MAGYKYPPPELSMQKASLSFSMRSVFWLTIPVAVILFCYVGSPWAYQSALPWHAQIVASSSDIVSGGELSLSMGFPYLAISVLALVLSPVMACKIAFITVIGLALWGNLRVLKIEGIPAELVYLTLPVLIGAPFVVGDFHLLLGVALLVHMVALLSKPLSVWPGFLLLLMSVVIALTSPILSLVSVVVLTIYFLKRGTDFFSFSVLLVALSPMMAVSLDVIYVVQDAEAVLPVPLIVYSSFGESFAYFINLFPVTPAFDLYRLIIPFLFLASPVFMGYRLKRSFFRPYWIVVGVLVGLALPVTLYGEHDTYRFWAFLVMLLWPFCWQRKESGTGRWRMVLPGLLLSVYAVSYVMTTAHISERIETYSRTLPKFDMPSQADWYLIATGYNGVVSEEYLALSWLYQTNNVYFPNRLRQRFGSPLPYPDAYYAPDAVWSELKAGDVSYMMPSILVTDLCLFESENYAVQVLCSGE